MIRTNLFKPSIELLLAMAASSAMFLGTAGPCRASVSDAIDATCRVTAADGSCGTGCVFEIGQGSIYVLTAAHVVGNDMAATVKCEFWRGGHQSAPLAGRVIGRSEDVDAAIVAVPQSALGGLLPRLVPLAPRDRSVRPGDALVSVGCAGGTWATAWKGHALGYEGNDLHFVPAPANGRSGSAVFDGEGRRIVAIVRARAADGSDGVATSVQAVYRAFDAAFSGAPAAHPRPAGGDGKQALVQCPNGQCPNGQCPLQNDRYLLPYRQKQADQDRGGQNPWPSIQGTIAAGPDYSAKLDKLIELQEKAAVSQSQSPPPPPDYGPQIREAADTAKEASKKADEAKAAIRPAIEEAMKPVHDDLTKLKPAIEMADKVQAKLDKLAELPGPLGKPAQKIEADLAAGNVDQAMRDAAKTVGAVLLVLGLITAITLHLIGQHKGAIRVLADQLAAQNPNNTTLQTIAQKIDSVEDKIASKLPAGLVSPLTSLPISIPGLPAAGVAAGVATGVVDAAANAKADLLAQQVSQLAGQVGQLQTNATPPASAAPKTGT
jgi:hypothetical protein